MCTKEVCAFRDAYTTFEKHGAQVIGLSSDAPDKLSSFAKVSYVLGLSSTSEQMGLATGCASGAFTSTMYIMHLRVDLNTHDC